MKLEAEEIAAIADAVVARLQPDEPVRLDQTGFEHKAVLRLVAEGRLPVQKIGRHRYTSKRALLALIPAASVTDRASQPQAEAGNEETAAALGAALRRQTRKAGAA